jgi:hypothetical protein
MGGIGALEWGWRTRFVKELTNILMVTFYDAIRCARSFETIPFFLLFVSQRSIPFIYLFYHKFNVIPLLFYLETAAVCRV